ncbi:AAA family ATPase [Variovorax sp. Varisp41]|uniref:AAA family ATPase n=1 Tax=Variovorax sp. Varisp41 TaxID=3243033 RepID=UPI0039B5CAAA
MLDKIICLDNVGVFQQGIPKAVDLGKVTLVYAENGRGKSTLAAVLSSLGSGDTVPVVARHTFGGGAQKAHIRGTSAGRSMNAILNGTIWSATCPEILVFDQHFIERNVHAGSEVSTSHHEALLEFALGDAAVTKKLEVDEASDDQTNATRRRTAAEEKLRGFMGKMPYGTFEKLVQFDNVDERILAVEQRIAAARDAASITARASLSLLSTPSVDFFEVRAVLARSLKDVHAEASRIVRTHLAHLPQKEDADAEAWASSGLAFMRGTDCPFCSQSTEGLPLIAAYQSYFDEAYTRLMAEVHDLERLALNSLDPGGIAAFERTEEANRERINVWSPQLALTLDLPDINATRKQMAAAKVRLDGIVCEKLHAPLVAVSDAELNDIQTSLLEAFAVVTRYNQQVVAANKLIAEYQAKLASEKVSTLQEQLAAMRANKTRFQPEVVALVAERQQADTDRNTAEAAKKVAREQLDTLMESVLGSFQSDINTWLAKFGADFTVVKLKPTYVGPTGAPRTEYGLSLRGSTVPAGRRSLGPCFQTALSDGDKRSLALAFFLARLFGDPGPANRVVIVDDMFTSLDKHRRAQTVDAIAYVARSVEQVFVFAHDAFFLRDVNRRLVGKGICTPVVLEAARAANGYSELRAAFDLDEVCATDFYKRYRALEAFLDGKPSESSLSTAQGMRPLLEGHLHRRFPGRISEGLTVGAVLATIKTEPNSSPLSVLQPSLGHLNELNDFASAFHHDTSGIAARTEVTDSELHAYGKQMMQFLHTGSL